MICHKVPWHLMSRTSSSCLIDCSSKALPTASKNRNLPLFYGHWLWCMIADTGPTGCAEEEGGQRSHFQWEAEVPGWHSSSSRGYQRSCWTPKESLPFTPKRCCPSAALSSSCLPASTPPVHSVSPAQGSGSNLRRSSWSSGDRYTTSPTYVQLLQEGNIYLQAAFLALA